MIKIRSKIVRVNEELVKEINEIAKKNNIKFIEASREVANAIRNNKLKKRKMSYEIQF